MKKGNESYANSFSFPVQSCTFTVHANLGSGSQSFFKLIVRKTLTLRSEINVSMFEKERTKDEIYLIFSFLLQFKISVSRFTLL